MWNLVFAVANKFVTLGGQLALAWLLLPADMGLANMAQAMAASVAILSVGGLGDVLLQRGWHEDEASQAIWLSLAFSVVMGLMTCSLALISPSLGRPEVRNLLYVLSIATVVGSPGTVLGAALKRKLDFKGFALAQFCGGVFYTLSALGLAWRGWGPMALIAPLVPKLLVTIAVMVFRGGGVDFVWPRWGSIVPLVRPTLALSFVGLFIALQSQAPVLIAGLILDPKDTGLFSWGWALASQVIFLLATNLREVLLPTFTQMKNDEKYRAEKAMQAARAMTALLCVVCGMQALLAGFMIKIFVPEKWLPAQPVVMFASLGLVFQGVWISGTAWLNACGRYRNLVQLTAAQALLVAGLTWIGAKTGGMLGATLGCAIAGILGSLASIAAMDKELLIELGQRWWKPLMLSAALWPACYILSKDNGTGAEIGASVAFGGFSAWVWWREDDGGLASIIVKIRELISRKLASTARPT